MGLRETVVLAQVRNLLWVFLVLDFLHDFKPVRHLFAVALFDGGEVGLAGGVLGHVSESTFTGLIQSLFILTPLGISETYMMVIKDAVETLTTSLPDRHVFPPNGTARNKSFV